MPVNFSWDCSAPKRKDSPVPGSSTTWASSLLLPGIIITLRLWSLLMSLYFFCWCRIWTCGLANLRALSCARGTCFDFCYFVRLSYSSHHLMIWPVDYIGLYCLGILLLPTVMSNTVSILQSHGICSGGVISHHTNSRDPPPKRPFPQMARQSPESRKMDMYSPMLWWMAVSGYPKTMIIRPEKKNMETSLQKHGVTKLIGISAFPGHLRHVDRL